MKMMNNSTSSKPDMSQKHFPEFVRGAIPYASEVERMGVYRMPLLAYSPSSAAAKAYRALWSEVRAILFSTHEQRRQSS